MIANTKLNATITNMHKLTDFNSHYCEVTCWIICDDIRKLQYNDTKLIQSCALALSCLTSSLSSLQSALSNLQSFSKGFKLSFKSFRTSRLFLIENMPSLDLNQFLWGAPWKVRCSVELLEYRVKFLNFCLPVNPIFYPYVPPTPHSSWDLNLSDPKSAL